jgi:hypothetical protein
MMLMTWRIYPLSNTYEGNIQERPDDAKLYLNHYTNIHKLKPPIFSNYSGYHCRENSLIKRGTENGDSSDMRPGLPQ